MRTREELLLRLVEILAHGQDSHTDCVNALSDLLEEEADASEDSPGQEWTDEYAAMPVPR